MDKPLETARQALANLDELLAGSTEMIQAEVKQLRAVIDRLTFDAAVEKEQRRLTPLIDRINNGLNDADLPATVRFFMDSGFTGIEVIVGDPDDQRRLLIEDSFADHARVGVYANDDEGFIFDLGSGKPMLDSVMLDAETVVAMVVTMVRFALNR
jgi:hypothetical protein